MNPAAAPGPEAGEVLADLVASAVRAADALLATPAGQARVRAVAARLTANALAATGHLPPALGTGGTPGGPCTLLGATGGTDRPAEAAGLTAAAITVTQCDEGLREARGHPGLHAHAAALATAEAGGDDLRTLLRALAVGWEVGARLGLLFGPLRAGVHPHGGWGTATAAAAAGTVLGLDPAGLTRAVNLALTVGLTGPESDTRRGHVAHLLLPALGTRSGVEVAHLVRDGFADTDPAVRHFGSVAHLGAPTPTRVEAALTTRPLLPAAYVKPVGVCAHTLTAWTAARGLPVRPEQVRTVTVSTYAAAALLAGRRPANRLARQFSIPWVVACALLDLDPAAPPDPAGGQPPERVGRLAERVTVRHDPELDAGYPAGRPVLLEVETAAGRLTARARFHPGDRETPLDPAGSAAVQAALLATPGVPEGAADLLRAVAEAPGDTPLRQLTHRVRSGSPTPATTARSTPREDVTSW